MISPFLGSVGETQLAWRARHSLSFSPRRAHATDLVNAHGTRELKDYIIGFVNILDPNDQPGIKLPWPQSTYTLFESSSIDLEGNAISSVHCPQRQ